jgi:hypothetical protein
LIKAERRDFGVYHKMRPVAAAGNGEYLQIVAYLNGTTSVRFAVGDTVSQKVAVDAKAAGGCGNIVIRRAQRFGDKVVDDGIEGEAGWGQLPGRVTPFSRRDDRTAEMRKVKRVVSAEDNSALQLVG